MWLSNQLMRKRIGSDRNHYLKTMEQQTQQLVHETVMDKGIVFSEKSVATFNFFIFFLLVYHYRLYFSSYQSEILCKPKIMPIKGAILQRMEEMERKAAQGNQQNK